MANAENREQTKDQISSVMLAAMALANAIEAVRSIPSGHLYAHVCNRMSLETFRGLIGILTRAKLVEERAHVLHWVG